MARYFFPYLQDRPAILSINGHRLVVVSSDRSEIEDSLPRFGADTVSFTEDWESKEDSQSALHEIADAVDAGIVIAPEDTPLAELLEDLEEELPWIQ